MLFGTPCTLNAKALPFTLPSVNKDTVPEKCYFTAVFNGGPLSSQYYIYLQGKISILRENKTYIII